MRDANFNIVLYHSVKNKILITYWDHDILFYLHEYRVFRFWEVTNFK